MATTRKNKPILMQWDGETQTRMDIFADGSSKPFTGSTRGIVPGREADAAAYQESINPWLDGSGGIDRAYEKEIYRPLEYKDGSPVGQGNWVDGDSTPSTSTRSYVDQGNRGGGYANQEKDALASSAVGGLSSGGTGSGMLSDTQRLGATIDDENKYMRRSGAVLLR